MNVFQSNKNCSQTVERRMAKTRASEYFNINVNLLELFKKHNKQNRYFLQKLIRDAKDLSQSLVYC